MLFEKENEFFHVRPSNSRKKHLQTHILRIRPVQLILCIVSMTHYTMECDYVTLWHLQTEATK